MQETIEKTGGKEERGPTPESLRRFKEAIKGWRTHPDGGDRCPDCWPKYLNKFDKKLQELIKNDSRPLSQYAETRKASDGWLAFCEECKKDVFTPY